MGKPYQQSIAARKRGRRRSRLWWKHNLRRQSFPRWWHVAGESDSWQRCRLRLSQRRGTSQRQLRGKRVPNILYIYIFIYSCNIYTHIYILQET